MKDQANLPALLRRAGYKVTPSRIALLAILKASKDPLSIQEIMKKLKHKSIDQATVYRILEVLEKIGTVRQINLRHGHADYEFSDPDDHHHIVCIHCKKVEDVKGHRMDEIDRQALRSSKKFSRITQHSLEFFGICKSCAAKL